uniref:ARAD1C31900p n=1 Tax=Blastobotrys adeninivorans TaxID=409370 RepID=A0A060T8T3_BLAAD
MSEQERQDQGPSKGPNPEGTQTKSFPKHQDQRKRPRRKRGPRHKDQVEDPRKEPPAREAAPEVSEMCVVCTEDIRYAATFQCNHFVCHVCALRMRALLKQDRCPSCRTSSPFVAISADVDRPYGPLPVRDDHLGLMYGSEIIKEDAQYLLKFNCPVIGCDEQLNSWKELKHHVDSTHHRVLCDICISHKSAFSIELETFTPRSLLIHQRDGAPEKGFKGHPQCKFCNKRFYSPDELYIHSREKHEQCFICDRRDREAGGPPKQPTLYRDYNALEAHFKAAHFACMMPVCLTEKFVVFGTQVELQDHMLQRHPEVVGNSKAARRIEPTFVRGGFQGQLSTVDPSAVSSSSSSASQNTDAGDNAPRGPRIEAEAFPVLGSSRSSSQQQSTSVPQQPATVTTFHARERAADTSLETLERRLEERARLYLKYDTQRMERFNDINRRYKADSLSATALVFEYSRLFDNPPDEIGLVVETLSKILQANKNSRAKAKTLTDAFNQWRSKQTNYPSLGSSSNTSTRSSSPVSTPTLNSMNSTWSKRSGAPGTNLASGAAFPSLPKKASAPAAPAGSSSVNGVTRGVKTLSVSNAPKGKKIARTPENFPSLPTAKKTPPPVSAPVTPTGWTRPEPESEPESDFQLDPRRKGKKKQVIMRIGM